MGERLDAVVAEPAGRIGVDDPGQVAALVEQLGRIGQLADDEVDHRVGRDRPGAPPDRPKSRAAMFAARTWAL